MTQQGPLGEARGSQRALVLLAFQTLATIDLDKHWMAARVKVRVRLRVEVRVRVSRAWVR